MHYLPKWEIIYLQLKVHESPFRVKWGDRLMATYLSYGFYFISSKPYHQHNYLIEEISFNNNPKRPHFWMSRKLEDRASLFLAGLHDLLALLTTEFPVVLTNFGLRWAECECGWCSEEGPRPSRLLALLSNTVLMNLTMSSGHETRTDSWIAKETLNETIHLGLVILLNLF